MLGEGPREPLPVGQGARHRSAASSGAVLSDGSTGLGQNSVAGGLQWGGVLVLMVALAGLNVGGWRARLLGRATSPKIESLAVLPLENLSRDPDQDYFADGMTEALITDLSKIGALRVISRTSVMQYKGGRKSLPQIAKELNVDALIEGSVQRSGDRVRISAQLIQAATDRHLWAESYERDLSNVLALESEVAQAIVSEIRVKVTPQEKVQFANARAVNPAAFQLYLQGRYYWNKRTREGFHKAIDYFSQAIDKDSNYALAYAGLADNYALLGEYKLLAAEEAYPRAREAVKRALELDEMLGEAHTTLAEIKMSYDWDWPGAGREFRRAIELNPGYPTAHDWYSAFLSYQGRHEEALEEDKRAEELDPLSLIINMHVGQQLTYALGKAYLRKGSIAEAIAEFQKARALSPYDTRYAGALGHAYARAGRSSEARKVPNELKEQSKRRYVSWYSIACIYAGLEEKDQAFASLRKAYEQRDTGLVHLKVEPLLDPLGSDPRFQDLVHRIGLPP